MLSPGGTTDKNKKARSLGSSAGADEVSSTWGRLWRDGTAFRLDYALLVVLSIVLPFELKTPIARLAGLEITNVEALWYVFLVVWIIGRLRTGAPRWTLVHGAVFAWAAAVVLSAAFAPSERAAACKFAVRMLGGCALFLAAADLVTTPIRAGRLMFGLSLGAVMSAAGALVEIWIGASSPLSVFKTEPARMGGFLRAGGTFQYPNIGAMYWEAVLPLLLAAAVWAGNRRRWMRWAGTLGSVILVAALVLSVSRAGMLTAFVVLSAMLTVARAKIPDLRAPAAMALLAILTLAAVSRLPALRLRSDELASWYRAEYRTVAHPATVKAGESFPATVAIRNAGLVAWRATDDHPITLAYCWYDPATESARCWDGPRTPLPGDVEPLRELTVATKVVAPPVAGRYVLQWDLVHEGIAWFGAYGTRTGETRIEVEPAAGAAPVPARRWVTPLPEIPSPDRIQLWRAALQLWSQRPLLGIGPDNFRHRYGDELGLTRHDDRIHANSWYLETLSTLGIAGVLASLALIAALLEPAKRLWRTATTPQGVLGFGLVLSLGAFFVHGLVDYFLPFTPTCGLFWLLAGATAGLAQAPSPGRVAIVSRAA